MHCPNQSGCSLAENLVFIPQSTLYCPECGADLHPGKFGSKWVFAGMGILVFLALAVFPFFKDKVSRTSSAAPIDTSLVTPLPSPDSPSASPARSAAQHSREEVFLRAETLADAVVFDRSGSAVDLAEALARKGKADEITDPNLLAAIVYRWIATNIGYDVASLEPTSRAPQDPDKVLASRVAVCEGYACLTEFVFNHLGIETRIVHGLARTTDHPIGHPLDEKRDGHAWNLVKWEGDWHLLDVTWGAGPVNQGRFKPVFNWEWFDAAPAIAIYSHYPEAPADQLLPSPVAQKDVQEAAHLRPFFFRAIDLPPLPLIAGTFSPGAAPVTWRTKPGFRLMAHTLGSGQGAAGNPVDARAFVTANGATEIHFPGLPAGEYDLHVFAGEAGQTTFSHCGKFHLRLEASNGSPSPPKTYPKYQTSGIRLIDPVVGILTAGQWQQFTLQAPVGLSPALQYDGETTLSHFTIHNGKYVTRLKLREGNLSLVLVENGKIWTLAEFEVTKK